MFNDNYLSYFNIISPKISQTQSYLKILKRFSLGYWLETIIVTHSPQQCLTRNPPPASHPDIHTRTQVALLWRSESRLLHYQWLEDGWLMNSTASPEKHLHQETTLKILLKRMIGRGRSDTGYTVALDNDLVDEHLEVCIEKNNQFILTK